MAEATVANSNEHVRKGNPVSRFVFTYVFATDHKIIGLQFLFSSLIWFFVGGFLALAVRWQLAWPWSDMPIFGHLLFADTGGQMSPNFYTMLFTMHATIMIFFVIIPILAGAFGNFLIPLMIGAEDMAFPRVNMMSYWFMWPAFGFIILSFFLPEYGPSAGWTSYPPLSVLENDAQSFWLMAMVCVGI
jgi:cytochrome c oxidase subunit 1